MLDLTHFTGMDLITGQLSETSQRTYQTAARVFARWMQDTGLSPGTLTEEALVAYRAYLLSTYDKPATANLYLTIALRLTQMQYKKGILPTDITQDIRGIKTSDETTHRVLTEEEATTLLNAPDLSTLEGWRDYMVLLVLSLTGIRREEAANMRLSDLGQQQGYFIATVQHGKGDQRRTVKITGYLHTELCTYLEKVRAAGISLTFLFFAFTPKGEPTGRGIGAKTIERIVKKYGAQIGIPELTPHGLRATFITLGFENGATDEQMRQAAGHKDARTTLRYHARKLNLKHNGADTIPIRRTNA